MTERQSSLGIGVVIEGIAQQTKLAMAEDKLKDKIVEITRDILGRVGFGGQVKIVDSGLSDETISVVAIESDQDLSMLIGRNGQNLNAFEHVVRLIVAKQIGPQTEPKKSFVIDINDYRKSRARYVLDTAKEAAQRVISSQKAETLLPMSSYERRLVHMGLASYKEIQTESIGEEPRRRVVVKPLLVNEIVSKLSQ